MDLATLTNAPKELSLCGASYTVSALTLAEWGILQAWLKSKNRNPVTIALEQLAETAREGIKVEVDDRRALLSLASEQAKVWPPMIGSGAWFDLIQNTDGGPTQFLKHVLRKHQPAITEAECDKINTAMDADESQAVIYSSLGMEIPPKPLALADQANPTRA